MIPNGYCAYIRNFHLSFEIIKVKNRQQVIVLGSKYNVYFSSNVSICVVRLVGTLN
jgi:hypothetical protein